MVMTALTDEETQKKGMVLVGHNMGHKSATDRTPVRAIMRMRQVLPMRVVTLHYCHDNAKARPIMYLAAFLSGAYGRVRFRPQYGSPSEVRFKLSTFGIPIDTLPITEEGECKLKPHKQWVQRRRKEEKAAAADGMQRVVVPSRFDVLFVSTKFSLLSDQYCDVRFASNYLSLVCISLYRHTGPRQTNPRAPWKSKVSSDTRVMPRQVRRC